MLSTVTHHLKKLSSDYLLPLGGVIASYTLKRVT